MNVSYKNLYLIIFISIYSFTLSAMQEQEESDELFVDCVLSNLNWPDQDQLLEKAEMQSVCPLAECQKIFKTLESLHEHVLEHMLKIYQELQEADDNESHNNYKSVIKYTCNLCSKPATYTSPGWFHAHLLKKHGEVYWPDLNYSCNKCKIKFKTKKAYDTHSGKCLYGDRIG